MLTKQTAMDIALAYREIETAEKLRADVVASADNWERRDLRDVFGRRVDNLELGIPSGDTSRRIFQVPYSLALPVIDAHIALHRSRIAALNEVAKLEVASCDGSAKRQDAAGGLIGEADDSAVPATPGDAQPHPHPSN